MAGRMGVRYVLGLADHASAVRWGSATASWGRWIAWREVHDAGIGQAHGGGLLRTEWVRVVLEVCGRT